MTRHWNLPPMRASAFPTPPDLAARREAGTGPSPWVPDTRVVVSHLVVGGVPCVVCEPPSPQSVSVYLHGGGYRLGTSAGYTPFATRLAGATGSTVVVVDYRLAPESPFPAALHDAAAVYGQLLDDGHRAIVAVGDSAGGGLAAALVVAAATSDIPPPAGLVLMSAWLDLTCTATTFVSCAGSDQMFSLDSARQATRLYLQGHDPREPLASPAFARIETWPPSLVLASTSEVLVQDSLTFVATTALAGASTTAVFESGRPHAWPAVFPDLPESVSALASIARFYARLSED